MSSQINDYIKTSRNMDRLLKRMVNQRRRIETDFFASTDMTTIFDSNGNYIFVSESRAQHAGLSPADMENHNWREVGLPEEIMLPVEQQIKSVFNTGLPEAGTVKYFDNKTRQLAYIDYYLRPMYKENGYIGAVICTARDVTQIRRNEDFVRRSAARLKQVLEICPVPILVIDEKEAITIANHSMAEYFPYCKPEDLIGAPFQIVLDRFGVRRAKSMVLKALNGEIFSSVFCVWGEFAWLVSAVPLRSTETGDITGVLAVFEDITELQRMQEKMARLNCLNLVGEMAAGVAHEVRNPLTVIRGYLQNMQAKEDVRYRDRLAIVMDELTRVEGIISDFLSLARYQQCQPQLRNLNQIVGSLLPLLEAEASKQGIAVRCDFEENLADILLYEAEIKQLVLNLARNGLEAMSGRNGLLTIATRRVNDDLVLSVGDTGCGISSELMEQIFRPFFSTKENGTGMGLAVCARIAKHHGGSIEAKSLPGSGTTFLVWLPCK